MRTQKGGLRQTHAEVMLWRATTPEQKRYWRERVNQEKQTGGSGTATALERLAKLIFNQAKNAVTKRKNNGRYI